MLKLEIILQYKQVYLEDIHRSSKVSEVADASGRLTLLLNFIFVAGALDECACGLAPGKILKPSVIFVSSDLT
jgi:hypothetical protein